MEEGIIKKWFEDSKAMMEEPRENKRLLKVLTTNPYSSLIFWMTILSSLVFLLFYGFSNL